MKPPSESVIGILVRVVTDSTISRAVQVATLRVVETLAQFCSTGLANDMRQLRENVLARDLASATKEDAEGKIKSIEATRAANQVAQEQRRAAIETRRLEAEATVAEIRAKREADIEIATTNLKATLRRLRAAGGAVFFNVGEIEGKTIPAEKLTKKERAARNAAKKILQEAVAEEIVYKKTFDQDTDTDTYYKE